MYSVTTLPVWAQKTIKKLEEENKNLKKAHSLLTTHEWYTIPGPDFKLGETQRDLFVLQRNHAQRVASLGEGDLLLVGLKKEVG